MDDRGQIDRRVYDLCMTLRQVGRFEYGRIFGTAMPSDGRYKAMMNLFEKFFFMRAEINALTKILFDKGLVTAEDLQKRMADEYEMYVKEVTAGFPEIEFGPTGFTIKDPGTLAARAKAERWPP